MPRAKPLRSPIPPGCLDHEALLRSLARDCSQVPVDSETSYDVSYPEFLAYFGNCGDLTRHHLIIGANFSYGWMPTILDFRERDFERGVEILRRSSSELSLTVGDIEALSRIVNNSIVGASKLLHFVSPTRYAIWDSRVAKYLDGRIDGGSRGAAQYRAYNDCMREIGQLYDATAIVETVGKRVGYSVTSMRALELVMYHAGLRGCSYLG